MENHWFTLLVCVVFGGIALYRFGKIWWSMREKKLVRDEKKANVVIPVPWVATPAIQDAEIIIHFVWQRGYDGVSEHFSDLRGALSIPSGNKYWLESDVDFYCKEKFHTEPIPDGHPCPFYAKVLQLYEAGVFMMHHLRLQRKGMWIVTSREDFEAIAKILNKEVIHDNWIIHVGFDTMSKAADVPGKGPVWMLLRTFVEVV